MHIHRAIAFPRMRTVGCLALLFIALLSERVEAQPCWTSEGDRHRIVFVAFLPDGKTILSGNTNYEIKLWDGKQKKRIAVFAAPSPGWGTGSIGRMALSGNGRIVATAGSGHPVELWDVAGRKLISHLAGTLSQPGRPPEVSTFAFSPDSKTFATAGSHAEVLLWNLATAKEKAVLKLPLGHWVSSLAFSPNGKTLAMGMTSGEVHLWDVAQAKLRKALQGHDGSVSCLAFSPDSKLLASGAGGKDRLVILWDVVEAKEYQTYRFNQWRQDGKLELMPDGRRIAPVLRDPRGLAFSPDGKRLAIVGKSACRCIHVWNVDRGREQYRIQTRAGEIRCVAFSPDGKRLAVDNIDDGKKVLMVFAVPEK
jgi:WD40 repeat protein